MPKTMPIKRLLNSTNSPVAAPVSVFAEELVGAAAENEELPLDERGDEEEDVSEGSVDSGATEDWTAILVLGATVEAAVPYALAALQYDILTC